MNVIVALVGLGLMGMLGVFQAAAVVRPRARWTIDNVYGGEPDATDPTAYFAFNQGFAWADVAAFVPLQVAASVGLLLDETWGFALGMAASAPFWYTAIQFFIWDRDLGFRQPTLSYWVVIWGMWPVFGVVEGVYCFARLTG